MILEFMMNSSIDSIVDQQIDDHYDQDRLSDEDLKEISAMDQAFVLEQSQAEVKY